MTKEFKFPDVGEGLTEGKLDAWKVKVGDVVTVDQTLAEVETDKATVEIPSPYAGTITKLHNNEGDTLYVGNVIVTFDGDVDASAPAPEATKVEEVKEITTEEVEKISEPIQEKHEQQIINKYSDLAMDSMKQQRNTKIRSIGPELVDWPGSSGDQHNEFIKRIIDC